MNEDLTIQGAIAKTTVPDLLRPLLLSGEHAVLTLESVDRHDNLYLADGRIVYATTSDPDLGLAEVLLSSGEIDLRQYRTASEKFVGNKQIGAHLCELGYLKHDELTRALEQQVAKIVFDAVRLRDGNYTMELRDEFPSGIPQLSIQTDRLILDAIARIEQWSLIERGIARLSATLAHAERADARVYYLDLTEEENHVYGLLSEPQTIDSLCSRSCFSNFVTCRAAWALLTVNLLSPATGEGVNEMRVAMESEIELESEVEKYNSAFQSAFQLVFSTIGDHTYDFIDRVILHLSPEMLPYLSGVNLMNEGRIDFDQLLNNLIASGSTDRRTIVLGVLNEMLYGWVFEIRTEFGSRFDDEITAIVAPLR